MVGEWDELESPYNDSEAITILNDYPGSFDLLSPEDGYDQVDRETYRINFEWTEAENVDADTLSYSLIMHVDYDDIDEIITHAGIESTEFAFNDLRSILIESGVFHDDTLNFEVMWWVEAYDGELITESNERRTLIIPVPLSVGSIFQEAPFKFYLNPAFPNPFNNVSNVRFNLPKAGNVRLAMYDINGRETLLITDGSLHAGTHNLTFNAHNLSTGAYLLRLDANGESQTVLAILMK